MNDAFKKDGAKYPEVDALEHPRYEALANVTDHALNAACAHRSVDKQRNFTVLIVGFDMQNPTSEQEAIEAACNELTGQGTLLAGKSIITESVVYDVGDAF